MSRKYLDYILEHICNNKLFVDKKISKQFYITANPDEISESELKKLQSVNEFIIEPGITNVYTNEKHNILIRRNGGRPYIMWCLSDADIPPNVIGCYKYAFECNHRQRLFIPHSMYYCTIMSILAADADEIIFEDGLERITLNDFNFEGRFEPEITTQLKTKRIYFPKSLKNIDWFYNLFEHKNVLKVLDFEKGGRFEKCEGMLVDNKDKKVLTVYDKVPEVITYQGKIICDNAFNSYDKSYKEKIIFPKSFEIIEKHAFLNATFSDIIFEGKLIKIAPNAFYKSSKRFRCFKISALQTDPLDFIKNDIDLEFFETYLENYKNNLIDLKSETKIKYDHYLKLNFDRIIENLEDIEYIFTYVIVYNLIDKEKLLNTFSENACIQKDMELKSRLLNKIISKNSVQTFPDTNDLFVVPDEYSDIKDDFDFVESNKGLTLSNYKGTGEEVFVPKKINGKKIALTSNSFDKLRRIKKLTIGCGANNQCFAGIIIEDLYFEEGLTTMPKINFLEAVNIHFPKSIKNLEYKKVVSSVTKTIEVEEPNKYFINCEDKKCIVTKDKKQVALCIDLSSIPSSCCEVLPKAYYFGLDEYQKLPENIKVVSQYPIPLISCIISKYKDLTINDSLEDFIVSNSSYFSHNNIKIGKSFKGNLEFLSMAFNYSDSLDISLDNPYYKLIIDKKLRMVFDKRTDELIFINYDSEDDIKLNRNKDFIYKVVVPSFVKKFRFNQKLMPFWAMIIIPKTVQSISFDTTPPFKKLLFEDSAEEVEKKLVINHEYDRYGYYYNAVFKNGQIFNYKIKK